VAFNSHLLWHAVRGDIMKILGIGAWQAWFHMSSIRLPFLKTIVIPTQREALTVPMPCHIAYQ